MLAQQQGYTSHLSAREQEHVAKMTNSPLVNMNTRRQPSPQASAGLVGAIEAREQEKKQLRQGISGQMVQHAIAQRQQQSQQQYQAYQQQMAYQQAQQQAQATLSPQAQAYQAQVAAGFFGQPPAQSRSTPNSPGGLVTPPSWPNGQTATYWGGQQPQPQPQPFQSQQGGQQGRPEWQAPPRQPAPGQKWDGGVWLKHFLVVRINGAGILYNFSNRR
jgi:CCR4-NOT transcriptional complex subunit CAF120